MFEKEFCHIDILSPAPYFCTLSDLVEKHLRPFRQCPLQDRKANSVGLPGNFILLLALGQVKEHKNKQDSRQINKIPLIDGPPSPVTMIPCYPEGVYS